MEGEKYRAQIQASPNAPYSLSVTDCSAAAAVSCTEVSHLNSSVKSDCFTGQLPPREALPLSSNLPVLTQTDQQQAKTVLDIINTSCLQEIFIPKQTKHTLQFLLNLILWQKADQQNKIECYLSPLITNHILNL